MFANVCLHAYVAEREPDHLPVLRAFPQALTAVDAATLPFHLRTLSEFEANLDMPGLNYGWYQCHFHVAAGQLYERRPCHAAAVATPGTTVVGTFSGRHEEMVGRGGLVVLPLPDAVDLAGRGRMEVVAVRGDDHVPVASETEWDLVLESDRGLTLASTGSATVSARVYHRNHPASGQRVRLVTQAHNRKSPIVASLVGDEVVTEESGRVHATVQAADLTAMGNVPDPVTEGPATSLPWDRYYGNYVFLTIDNPLRRNPWREEATEVVELAVRVLHRVDPDRLPAQPSWERDVRPLFAYQVRYFPWLHARRDKGRWTRFLDLDDVDAVRSRAPAILNRLDRTDDDFLKMPQSRDFPVGGVDVLRRWTETGMQR